MPDDEPILLCPAGSGQQGFFVSGSQGRFAPCGEAAPSGCAKRARDWRSQSPNKLNVTEGGYLKG